jgi:hypothetical protein
MTGETRTTATMAIATSRERRFIGVREQLLLVAKRFILSRFELPAETGIEKIVVMKITKNIGMLLLAVYLIVDGLLGFGLNLGPAIFLLYIIALAAGVFILLGK